ncbi:VC0807 family protein [Priestia megaterium]|uniref:VC0807 family protein n=1 Tax=Priestia megaterium TaxID=1404 RepID=UPI00336B70E4
MKTSKIGIIVSVLINIVLPYLIYTILKTHITSIIALSLAACVPLVDTLYHLIKDKKLDTFSSFIFLGIVLSIVAAWIGGDERFILLRESYVTGIMGLVFLLSLLTPKPLIYYFAMKFISNKSVMTKRWEEEVSFRHFIRIMAAVWGIGLMIEALVKVVIVYEFPISKALVISPIAQYIIIAILIYWNIHFVKQRKQKA